LGDRLGWDWLTYRPGVYRFFLKHARESAPPFAAIIRAQFPAIGSGIDVGCGPGAYVAALRAVGIAAEGYEYSRFARNLGQREFDLILHPLDLTRSVVLPTVDLAMSLEVAEHLTPEMGDVLVQRLTEAAPLVVFSAAQPGQGGQGHINEQPPSYWIQRFAARGFVVDDDATARIAETCRARAETPHLAKVLGRNVVVFRSAARRTHAELVS
jgi:hypothetical protein